MTAPRYRIWHIPQIPMEAFQVETDDLSVAVLIVDTLANYDLFQFEHRIKPDYANASGIQQFDTDVLEWWDVDEDEIAEELAAIEART